MRKHRAYKRAEIGGDKMLEKMKEIKGYEGLYRISTWGNVYSGKTNTKMYLETTPKGYKRVKLAKNGISKNYKVHRLVAEAFIPNNDRLPQINHIDGNKENNSVTNLEWVTDAQNKAHRKMLIGGM